MIRFVLALVLLLVAPYARADGTASFVEQGPIALDAAGRGRATLRNTGAAPLHVVTIYARSNERDPRIPGTLSASFEGGSTKGDLAPGESRALVLEWDRRGARMAQLFGHVVVETSDTAAPQRAIGVIGQPSSALGFLTHHAGSWLIALPLLAAAAIVALRRRFDDRLVRYVALGAVSLQGAIAVWTLRNFDALASRADGNDGLQMIERARLLGGVEWYLGFDGVSLPLVLTVIALAVVGVIASFPIGRRHDRFFPAYLVGVSAAIGALLAMDALLLGAFLVLFAIALFLASSGPIHMGVMHAIAIVLFLVVVLALRANTEATFLVDGARGRTSAIPELARGEWLERTLGGLRMYGRPFVQTAFVLLFVAAAIFLSAAPLHGALGRTLTDAPIGAAILASTAGTAIGTSILLRFGAGVLAEGLRWASPALAGLGAAGIVWGALAALGELDLRRIAAHVSVAHAGLIVLGVAAGTPHGLAGALGQSIARIVVVAMLLVVAGALYDRVRVADTSRFGGLMKEMPRFSVFATIAIVASFGMPGTLPFATMVLSIGGALPAHRVAPAIAALGVALLAVALLIVHRRALLGELDARWRKSPELEPFGGKFPDADPRETGLLFALAFAVVVFGLSPRFIVELSRGTISDLDARANVERLSGASAPRRARSPTSSVVSIEAQLAPDLRGGTLVLP